MAFTKLSWLKWELCIVDYIQGDAFVRAERGHDLVADYLERHPEIAIQYERGQGGGIKYFDVLAMAEKEVKIDKS